MSKRNIIIAACVVLVVALVCVGAFVIYPSVQASNQAKEDQKMADEVMDMIDVATSNVTLDSENQLSEAQQKYFSLPVHQQELVTNYDVLESAFSSLEA